jgi:hypothetical protein
MSEDGGGCPTPSICGCFAFAELLVNREVLVDHALGREPLFGRLATSMAVQVAHRFEAAISSWSLPDR